MVTDWVREIRFSRQHNPPEDAQFRRESTPTVNGQNVDISNQSNTLMAVSDAFVGVILGFVLSEASRGIRTWRAGKIDEKETQIQWYNDLRGIAVEIRRSARLADGIAYSVGVEIPENLNQLDTEDFQELGNISESRTIANRDALDDAFQRSLDRLQTDLNELHNRLREHTTTTPRDLPDDLTNGIENLIEWSFKKPILRTYPGSEDVESPLIGYAETVEEECIEKLEEIQNRHWIWY